MTDLRHLLARLEEATGPDRELDVEIGTYFGEADHSGPALHRPYRDWARPYTSSIDASLALVEKKLPGCQWTIEPDSCWIRVMGAEDVEEYQGFLMRRDGKCTAAAILIALIRALISNQTDAKEGGG